MERNNEVLFDHIDVYCCLYFPTKCVGSLVAKIRDTSCSTLHQWMFDICTSIFALSVEKISSSFNSSFVAGNSEPTL